MNITLVMPCFMDALYPAAGLSVVRILERLGHTVDFAGDVVCCGQPPFNSGYWNEARTIARRVLKRLDQAEIIVIPSGSCGAMLKVFYGELFAGEPEAVPARALSGRVWEFADFLVSKLGVSDLGASFPFKVTYHDGCHALRELKIKSAPRDLLRNVRGLDLVEMNGEETCCGFGGAFAVKYPMISTAMGEVKCDAAAAAGAEFIVSSDASCLMHLKGLLDRQGRLIKTMHLAEVLEQGHS